MGEATVLQLMEVSRQFSPGDQPAVNRVSFTLAAGELLGLLGPSGCGKTTLLRLIAGFEPLQQGRVVVAGQEIASATHSTPPEQRSIGMVFQDFALFPHLTLAQNVGFGLQGPAFPSAKAKALRTQEVIALVGLTGLEQRYPYELSGGQQQRVALARALAPQPVLILLDEPFSNLDVTIRSHLRQEVRRILKAADTTAIFVTHDQEEALAISDRVAVMYQGCLEQFDTPEQLYKQPRSRFVAQFVTQANFLPAQRQDDGWQTEVGTFGLMPSASPTLQQGELMVRQEDIQVQPDPAGIAVVYDRQFLGREQWYAIQTDTGRQLQVRTPADHVIPIDTRVRIEIAPERLQVFAI